jgi:hypothetical protein
MPRGEARFVCQSQGAPLCWWDVCAPPLPRPPGLRVGAPKPPCRSGSPRTPGTARCGSIASACRRMWSHPCCSGCRFRRLIHPAHSKIRSANFHERESWHCPSGPLEGTDAAAVHVLRLTNSRSRVETLSRAHTARRRAGAQPAHQVRCELPGHVAPERDGQKDTKKKWSGSQGGQHNERRHIQSLSHTGLCPSPGRTGSRLIAGRSSPIYRRPPDRRVLELEPATPAFCALGTSSGRTPA